MSPSVETRENRAFATEIKFLVTPLVGMQIRDWASAHLAPDPNAGGTAGDTYQITSVYFDTKHFDVFHQNGSYGRAKYRIRRYGRSETVFLERKLKLHGLLTKRRSTVSCEELPMLASENPIKGWSGYWYHRRLLARHLRPVCRIKYDRTARVAMTKNGPIRLTLDNNLIARPLNEIHFAGDDGVPLLNHRIILELKFCLEMPTLFKNLVEEFALNSIPFSKYRLATAGLISGLVMHEDSDERFILNYA